MGMMALGYEDADGQNRVANSDGIGQLIRIMKSPRTTPKVLMTAVQALGTLCIGKVQSYSIN